MKISANKTQEEIADDKKGDTLFKALAPGPSLWKNQSLNFPFKKLTERHFAIEEAVLQSYAKIQICQQIY